MTAADARLDALLAAERDVLGACLLHPDALAQVPELRPEHFHLVRHQLVFAAILAAQAAGVGVDPITIGNSLGQSGRLAEAGGSDALLDLCESVVTHVGIGDHARIVMAHAYRRQADAIARQLGVLLRDGQDVGDAVAAAQAQLQGLQDDIGNKPKRDGIEPMSGLPADDVAQLPPAEFVIESVLPEGIGIFGGPSTSGKSLYLIDMAERITRDMTWRGLNVHAGAVSYFCGEGFHGLSSRLAAWQLANPGAPPREHDFRIFDSVPPLGNPDTIGLSVERMRRTLAAAAELPVLVVFETLSNCTAGAEENSNGVLSAVLEAVKGLRAEFPSVSFYFSHHTRKGGDDALEDLRGAGVLGANTDAVLVSKRLKDLFTVTVHKSKEGADGLSWTSRLLLLDTGKTNRWGKPITSVTLIPAEVTAAEVEAAGRDQDGLQALEAAGVEGCTRPQFCAATGLKPTPAWEMLSRFLKDHRGVAKKVGRAWRYWATKHFHDELSPELSRTVADSAGRQLDPNSLSNELSSCRARRATTVRATVGSEAEEAESREPTVGQLSPRGMDSAQVVA